MDLSQIKNFIPCVGEKYIIVENGKAIMVLLSFEDYQKSFKSCGEKKLSESPEYKELKKEERIEERINEISEEKTKKELTIDDLPF